ncbi:MAG TPA: hypothetical protein VEI02_08800 [Planctomycetota bacterium]|nr:hypothetical protein [Planctomycetota bacterium]
MRAALLFLLLALAAVLVAVAVRERPESAPPTNRLPEVAPTVREFRVVDAATGAPIPDAEARRVDGVAPTAVFRADAHGVVDVAVAGAHARFEVTAPGYVAARVDALVPSMIEDGTRPVVALRGAASFFGRVTTADGRAPPSPVEVSFGEGVKTTTDVVGAYRLDGVRSGVDGHLVARRGEADGAIETARADGAVRVDLRLRRSLRWKLTVRLSRAAHGIHIDMQGDGDDPYRRTVATLAPVEGPQTVAFETPWVAVPSTVALMACWGGRAVWTRRVTPQVAPDALRLEFDVPVPDLRRWRCVAADGAPIELGAVTVLGPPTFRASLENDGWATTKDLPTTFRAYHPRHGTSALVRARDFRDGDVVRLGVEGARLRLPSDHGVLRLSGAGAIDASLAADGDRWITPTLPPGRWKVASGRRPGMSTSVEIGNEGVVDVAALDGPRHGRLRGAASRRCEVLVEVEIDDRGRRGLVLRSLLDPGEPFEVGGLDPGAVHLEVDDGAVTWRRRVVLGEDASIDLGAVPAASTRRVALRSASGAPLSVRAVTSFALGRRDDVATSAVSEEGFADVVLADRTVLVVGAASTVLHASELSAPDPLVTTPQGAPLVACDPPAEIGLLRIGRVATTVQGRVWTYAFDGSTGHAAPAARGDLAVFVGENGVAAGRLELREGPLSSDWLELRRPSVSAGEVRLQPGRLAAVTHVDGRAWPFAAHLAAFQGRSDGEAMTVWTDGPVRLSLLDDALEPLSTLTLGR